MDGLFDLLLRYPAHYVVTEVFWWEVPRVAPVIEEVIEVVEGLLFVSVCGDTVTWYEVRVWSFGGG
jgi:hypothetical protein